MPTIALIILVLAILLACAMMVKQQYDLTMSGWDGWDDDD
jgi:hypothetical protein